MYSFPNWEIMSDSFENLAYSWEMFLVEHFRRIKEIHYNDYDTYIIMQVVNSHFIYNKNKDKLTEDRNSWNELFGLAKSNDYNEKIIGEKNKLSISAISRVTSLPIETTRRKLKKLCNEGVIKIKKNCITFGDKHYETWQKIGSEEVKILQNFIKSIEENGGMKWLKSKEADEIRSKTK